MRSLHDCMYITVISRIVSVPLPQKLGYLLKYFYHLCIMYIVSYSYKNRSDQSFLYKLMIIFGVTLFVVIKKDKRP